MGKQTVDPQANRQSNSHRSLQSLAASCALLAIAIVPAGLLAGRLVAGSFDSRALFAAGVAVGVCWLAGALAISATYFGNRSRLPVQGLLLGMLLRMALPLIAGIVLQQTGGPLAEAGVFSMIVGVYLWGLVVETILSLRMAPPASALSKATS